MIDIAAETLLSMAEVAKLMPRRRRGRPCSLATIYRWSSPPGCRGIVLETAVIGGGRVTSREALQRFADALTRRRPGRASRSAAAAQETASQHPRLRKNDLRKRVWPGGPSPNKKSRGRGRSPARGESHTPP